MKTIIVMVLLGMLLVACGGRHVVANPEDVPTINNSDWQITSEPTKD